MHLKSNILCTICARGGSKGLKDKNIRLLSGKPLIAYTIEQALKWNKAKHVIVSTDSEKIADIAKRYGAKVPFLRPRRLATDHAPKISTIRHALAEAEKFYKEIYNIVVDLDPTAPIRKVKDLNNCLDIFIMKKPKTLFSVVRSCKNPYFNMVETGKGGFARICKKTPKEIVRRQNAPLVYSMNASIYFYDRDFLLRSRHLTALSDRSAVYIMDDLSAYDIDREIDLRFIEFLIKERIWKSEA